MRSALERSLVPILALVVLALVVACGPSPEEKAAAADEERWTQLIATQQQLTEAREQLAEARAAVEAAAEEGEEAAETPEEAAETPAEAETADAGEDAAAAEDPAERVATLEDRVETLSQELYDQIVAYINATGIVEGEMTERQLKAVRWKSAEDMKIAREYIERGGDYSRAINIYEQSLQIDPDNPELQAALEEAQRLQHMDEERFAQAKKGMTQEEIREVLGTVKQANQKEYEDGEIQAWFYRKENGGAAGVFFREEDGAWRVYEVDYDAAPPPGQG